MHVGIAGTGKMGTAIACNLLDRGYAVSVWNVVPAMMETAAGAGATACEDLEPLVAGTDATIAMLWDDEVARRISLERIIPAARTGGLLIESSTLSPQMYEALGEAAEQREVDFLACPVLGSVDGARNGTLTLLPGGTVGAFDRARDLLNDMGATIKFTGSPSASGHLKLAYNAMLCVNADAIGELLAVMGCAGVDRTLAIETLAQALERVATKRQQLIDGDTAPRFSANALLKDLRLACTARRALNANAPLMDRALEEFEKTVATGAGECDYIAVSLALERAAQR